jgi:hypothetical protein
VLIRILVLDSKRKEELQNCKLLLEKDQQYRPLQATISYGPIVINTAREILSILGRPKPEGLEKMLEKAHGLLSSVGFQATPAGLQDLIPKMKEQSTETKSLTQYVVTCIVSSCSSADLLIRTWDRVSGGKQVLFQAPVSQTDAATLIRDMIMKGVSQSAKGTGTGTLTQTFADFSGGAGSKSS